MFVLCLYSLLLLCCMVKGVTSLDDSDTQRLNNNQCGMQVKARQLVRNVLLTAMRVILTNQKAILKVKMY